MEDKSKTTLPPLEPQHIEAVMKIMRVKGYTNVVAWWNAFQKAFKEVKL